MTRADAARLPLAGGEVLAEVETFLIDDALRLRLAACVVVRGVVESAVAAYVERAAASLAFVAKSDPLDDFGRLAAMPTFHNAFIEDSGIERALIESATLVARDDAVDNIYSCMLNDIESFATSLAKAARASRHTVSNYRRDLMSLRAFLLERGSLLDANGEVVVDAITADHVRQYLAELMRNAAARATVQRRLSAIKAFFRYRESSSGATSPVRALRSPKSQRHLPVDSRTRTMRAASSSTCPTRR